MIRTTVLFCDDVRIERTGKHLIIGVYLNELIPLEMPSNVALSLWVRFQGIPAGNHRLALRIKPPGDVPSITVDGGGENGEDDVTMIVGGLPIELQTTGLLSVYVAFDGEPETEVGTIKITSPRSAAS